MHDGVPAIAVNHRKHNRISRSDAPQTVIFPAWGSSVSLVIDDLRPVPRALARNAILPGGHRLRASGGLAVRGRKDISRVVRERLHCFQFLSLNSTCEGGLIVILRTCNRLMQWHEDHTVRRNLLGSGNKHGDQKEVCEESPKPW